MYTVEVVNISKLQNPQLCIGEVRRFGHFSKTHGWGSQLFRPWGFGAETAAQWPEVVPAIQAWGYTAEDLNNAPAFRLVEPIAKLVLRRQWHSLVWLDRWKGLPDGRSVFQQYPGEELAQQTRGKVNAAAWTEVTHAKVIQLMQDLRKWLPAILAGVDGEDTEAVAD